MFAKAAILVSWSLLAANILVWELWAFSLTGFHEGGTDALHHGAPLYHSRPGNDLAVPSGEDLLLDNGRKR